MTSVPLTQQERETIADLIFKLDKLGTLNLKYFQGFADGYLEGKKDAENKKESPKQ